MRRLVIALMVAGLLAVFIAVPASAGPVVPVGSCPQDSKGMIWVLVEVPQQGSGMDHNEDIYVCNGYLTAPPGPAERPVAVVDNNLPLP